MRSTTTRVLFGICAPLLLAHTTAAPRAQFTVFVATVGNDTVAVDRFSRTAEAIEGTLLVRVPQPHIMKYKGTLAPPDGRFTHLELVWQDAKGVEMRRAVMSYGTDSIRSEFKGPITTSVAAAARLGALPLPPQPYATHAIGLLEHATIALLVAKGTPATELEWICVGDKKSEKRKVVRVQRDTIDIDYIAGPVRAFADSGRRLVWLTVGTKPVMTMVKRSADDIDIAKLMASFASRDTLIPSGAAGRTKS